ncbi:MAG: T9SS type A sorting domain-containing protein [Saprospiraceae bacterium]|nr:T9SS type A sorting domain-containing protein [Saprospiraceae bacterium]
MQTTSGEIWKINFTDFGGSLTGKAVFEKEKVGEVNAVNDPNAPLIGFGVYPNPANAAANLVFTAQKAASQAKLTLTDVHGRTVFQANLKVNQGLNGYVLPTQQLNEGVYFTVLKIDNQLFAEKLIIRH